MDMINDNYKRELWAKLGKYFSPPAALKNNSGLYPSPLKFYDGRHILTQEDWQQRRREILDYWHGVMGGWHELLAKPRIRYIKKEHVENFTRHAVSIEYAADKFMNACILIPDGDGKFPAVLVLYYTPEEGAGLNPQKRLQIDFGYRLAQRGFVTLNIGTPEPIRNVILYPDRENPRIQPLSFLAYIAANCHSLLSSLQAVDDSRIGIVGHSMGGKWAMFASCLYDKFACAAWSDPGIVFDETRADVNYWEPWYLGFEKGFTGAMGFPSATQPRRGAYKILFEAGHDLVELHALVAPRPFFVAGGSEDTLNRWRALNLTVAVNSFLGFENRVGMMNRKEHNVDMETNETICNFFEYFLK